MDWNRRVMFAWAFMCSGVELGMLGWMCIFEQNLLRSTNFGIILSNFHKCHDKCQMDVEKVIGINRSVQSPGNSEPWVVSTFFGVLMSFRNAGHKVFTGYP